MREIKFRVWDKEEKKMLNDSRATWILHTRNHVPYSDRYVLMQYTGLKDKGGKEIYEGDIVKDNFGHWDKQPVEMTPLFWHEFIEYGLENASLEIIGNIYENPEL